MINLKKGQDSPSLSSEFKKEFNNSSGLTLSFIDATLRETLFDKLALLRRRRDEILVRFIRMSIPEEIHSARALYPLYFKNCRTVEVTNEARTLVTFVCTSFPTDGDSIKIAVPAFIFDEIVGIDNCIEDILNSIADLN